MNWGQRLLITLLPILSSSWLLRFWAAITQPVPGNQSQREWLRLTALQASEQSYEQVAERRAQLRAWQLEDPQDAEVWALDEPPALVTGPSFIGFAEYLVQTLRVAPSGAWIDAAVAAQEVQGEVYNPPPGEQVLEYNVNGYREALPQANQARIDGGNALAAAAVPPPAGRDTWGDASLPEVVAGLIGELP